MSDLSDCVIVLVFRRIESPARDYRGVGSPGSLLARAATTSALPAARQGSQAKGRFCAHPRLAAAA